MKKLNPNKPVMLENGREVRNTCFDYKISLEVIGISGIVRSKDDCYDYQVVWFNTGKPYNIANIAGNSLINVPERIKGWINIYESHVHPIKQDADNNAGSGCIACIYIDVPVGEGLE